MGSEHNENNVRERLSFMLQGGRWTDCEFIVGTEHQEVVEGHKAILASASPVFEAMFFGDMAEIQTPIPIPDIQPATFKAMLDYIYTDDIKINSLDEAFGLYYAANKYILPNLKKICITIESMLTMENVCQVYEFASIFGEKSLVDKCLNFINHKGIGFLKYLSKSSILKDIKLSTLVTIFSLEVSTKLSALNYYYLTRIYLRLIMENNTNSEANCESSSEDNNNKVVVNGDSNAENCQKSLEQSPDQDKATVPSPTGSKEKPNVRPLLEKIHFLTLSPEEFVERAAISGLLTESEAYAILVNIISDKTVIPMPSGFSTFRRTTSYNVGECQSCSWRYIHANPCKCGR